MSRHGSNNIQYLGAGGLHDAYVATGGTGQIPTRDAMDALRLGQARQPGTDYPDGYLGTIRSRRDDRLTEAVQQRENTHPYSRGVHKGERIGVRAYFWPDNLDPQRGLRNQSRGVKTTPLIQLAETPVLINDGKTNMQPVGEAQQVDPVRSAHLQSLRPLWN